MIANVALAEERDRPLIVVLVEDDDGDAELVYESLRASNEAPAVSLRRATRLEDAFALLDGADAILLDLMLPDSRGPETLRRLRDRAPEVPVVVLSGLDDASVALDAVRHGAQDFISKGSDGLRVVKRVLRYAVERTRVERQMHRLHSLEHEALERRRTEERLRLSERRLAETQRLAHIGSWEWDIPSNRVAWSDETYRIFGRGAVDFDGTYEGVLNGLHPEDRGILHAAVARAYETRAPFDAEVRVVRPDGAVRRIVARGHTTEDGQGQVIQMAGTIQDLDGRERA